MENGGVKVVHMDLVSDHMEAQFVRFAHRYAGLYTAAAKPHCKSLRMMVTAPFAAKVGVRLDHRRPAKFSAPDQERILEKTTLFEVLDQRRAGLVGLGRLVFDAFDDFAMVVPTLVKKLHEPHTPFNQAAGEQAVHRE